MKNIVNSKKSLFAISLIMLFGHQQAVDHKATIKKRIEDLEAEIKEEKDIARSNWQAGRFGRVTRTLFGVGLKEGKKVLKEINENRKASIKEKTILENELEELRKLMALTCARCKKPEAVFKCGRCKIPYCSKDCQTEAWRDDHRSACK